MENMEIDLKGILWMTCALRQPSNQVLTERWVLVEAIAEALVRKRSLDQAELAKIVDNVQKDMS